MALVPAEGIKVTLKKYETLWNKIRYLIKSASNNWENKQYMKIIFNLDDDFKRW